jgi:hypothetical protein
MEKEKAPKLYQKTRFQIARQAVRQAHEQSGFSFKENRRKNYVDGGDNQAFIESRDAFKQVRREQFAVLDDKRDNSIQSLVGALSRHKKFTEVDVYTDGTFNIEKLAKSKYFIQNPHALAVLKNYTLSERNRHRKKAVELYEERNKSQETPEETAVVVFTPRQLASEKADKAQAGETALVRRDPQLIDSEEGGRVIPQPGNDSGTNKGSQEPEVLVPIYEGRESRRKSLRIPQQTSYQFLEVEPVGTHGKLSKIKELFSARRKKRQAKREQKFWKNFTRKSKQLI